MKGTVNAVRAGFERGRIELGQSVSSPGELLSYLWLPVAAVVIMYFVGSDPIPPTGVSLSAQTVPGILGMNVVFTGLMGLAMALTADREDGTLLRAKSTPNGVLGYLVGRVSGKAAVSVATLLVILVPAVLIFDGVTLDGPWSYVTLVWVILLGLTATLPLGAILGATFRNTQSLGFVTLFLMLLVAVSGVFYPLSAFPTWLQWVGQVFPMYWIGLGLRSALLPDSSAAIEVGGSWRPLATFVALAGWSAVGFVLTPRILSRMARRESGSAVEARREQVGVRAA